MTVLGRANAGLLVFLAFIAVHPLFGGCDEAVFDMPAVLGQTPLFDEVGAQLQEVKVLRASFKQKKKIKVLRRPLRSTGSPLNRRRRSKSYADRSGLPVPFSFRLRMVFIGSLSHPLKPSSSLPPRPSTRNPKTQSP